MYIVCVISDKPYYEKMLEADICAFERNVSTIIGWIAIKLGTEIHVSL